jgi:hypothetical protein
MYNDHMNKAYLFAASLFILVLFACQAKAQEYMRDPFSSSTSTTSISGTSSQESGTLEAPPAQANPYDTYYFDSQGINNAASVENNYFGTSNDNNYSSPDANAANTYNNFSQGGLMENPTGESSSPFFNETNTISPYVIPTPEVMPFGQ